MEDLLKERNLTLDTTHTKCLANEAAKCQREELAGGTPESSIHTKHNNAKTVLREARSAQGMAPVSTPVDADSAQLTT